MNDGLMIALLILFGALLAVVAVIGTTLSGIRDELHQLVNIERDKLERRDRPF